MRKASDKELAGLRYSYTQYAFVDFKDSDSFFKLFEEQIALAKKEDPDKGKRRKKKTSKTKLLKVDKVVVVNPIYKKVDTRKRQKVRHIESEEVLVNIDGKIKDVAERLNLKADIINPNNLSSSKVTVMQSNSLLNDWIDEQMRSDEDVRVSPIYNEIIALADSYKTDHFVWLGEFTLTRKRRGKASDSRKCDYTGNSSVACKYACNAKGNDHVFRTGIQRPYTNAGSSGCAPDDGARFQIAVAIKYILYAL
jgi:hypothetical protein